MSIARVSRYVHEESKHLIFKNARFRTNLYSPQNDLYDGHLYSPDGDQSSSLTPDLAASIQHLDVGIHMGFPLSRLVDTKPYDSWAVHLFRGRSTIRKTCSVTLIWARRWDCDSPREEYFTLHDVFEAITGFEKFVFRLKYIDHDSGLIRRKVDKLSDDDFWDLYCDFGQLCLEIRHLFRPSHGAATQLLSKNGLRTGVKFQPLRSKSI